MGSFFETVGEKNAFILLLATTTVDLTKSVSLLLYKIVSRKGE